MSKVWIKDASGNWDDYCKAYIKDANGTWQPVAGKQVWIYDGTNTWRNISCGPTTAWRALAAHCEMKTRIVTSITPVNTPFSIVYNPSNNRVYVANVSSATNTGLNGYVTVINPDTGAVTSTGTQISYNLRSIVYNPDNNSVYACSEHGDIYLVDPTTGNLTSFAVLNNSGFPQGVSYVLDFTYSTVTHSFFIGLINNTRVVEVNSSGVRTRVITGVTAATFTTVDNTGQLYITTSNGGGSPLNTLYIVAPGASTPSVTRTIGTINGSTCRKSSIDLARSNVFLPQQLENVVTVYNINNGTTSNIQLTNQAGNSYFLQAPKDRLVLGSRNDSIINIIRGSDFSSEFKMNASPGPIAIAYDSTSGSESYFVANYDANNISKISALNPAINTGVYITDTQEQYTIATGAAVSPANQIANTSGMTNPAYIPNQGSTGSPYTSCPIT